MRVLFVHERAGFMGGVEQNIAEAATGLRARGHVCLLAHGADGRDAAAFRDRFARSWRAADLDGTPSAAPPLADVIDAAAPDAVYLHRLSTVRAVGRWLGRLPVVRMVHDHDLCCPRRHKYFLWSGRACSLPAGARCWLDLAFVAPTAGRRGVRPVDLGAHRAEIARHRGLDALLVGSRWMRDELLGNGLPAKRVHILPPVVPDDGARPAPVPHAPRILFVGQLIRGKGVDLLLAALARLDVPFTAAVVGSGNAAAGLQARARRLGLDDRVTFTGWVDHDEIARLYRQARLLVVPSRWPEPFGMIGLEAMRHGRPVVGFAVGGIPDWLLDGQTGLLAPEQDVAALATCLRRVLTDDALAADLGARAARLAAERFGFQRYLDHLEQHLAGGRPPAWHAAAVASC